MIFKRIIIIGILLVLILTGCGSTTSERSEETLVYAHATDIGDLNPHLYSSEIFAQNLIYEGLVKVGETGEIEPWLAQSWAISEDGKTYTFKLRENVTFSDGTPWNAQVAKANLDAIIANAERHTWLESVNLLKKINESGGQSVEVTGEYELTIRLAESYDPFLIELSVTRPYRFVSTTCLIEGQSKEGITSPIGTGSYVLKEHQVNQYATFIANENYWGTVPNIKEVVVEIIPDHQTRVMALESGEVDLIYGMDSIDIETYLRFGNIPGFATDISEPISTRMLMLNTTDEILKDLKVRQALWYATDREIISEGIFSGVEIPADTIFTSSVPYGGIELRPYTYNLEKAKALLEEAGWELDEDGLYRQKEGQVLEITLHYSMESAIEKTLAVFYQSEMKKIGVKLKIIGEEKQSFQSRMKSGDFDMAFNNTWGAPYDPKSFLAGMRLSVHGDYMAQLGLEEKETIDEQIYTALTTTDETEREACYDYVLTTLHEKAVYIPLTHQRNYTVYNARIKGVTFNPSKFEIPIEKMSISE